MRRRRLGALALLLVAGCALRAGWHWERSGADAADYRADEIACKAEVYSGTGGNPTNASVRQMHACLQRLGWRRVDD